MTDRRPSDDGGNAETTGTDGVGGNDSEQAEESEASGHRRRLLVTVQWAVALGAFWYVARGVDWSAAAGDLAGIPASVVVAILAITVLEFGSRFSMWYALLWGRIDVSLLTTARIDLTIKFVNHVVPSKASGHSIAPLVLRHYTDSDWAEAVSIAGLNTGLYAALYGAVAAVGLAVFGSQFSSGWLLVIALSTGVYLAAGTVVLLAGRRLDVAGELVGRLESLLGRIPRVGTKLGGVAAALPAFGADSAAVFRERSGRPGVLAGYALGWAGTLMVFPGLRVWLLLDALGSTISPTILLPVVLVMAYSVTVLPLTPGGVGVAEASTTAVFVGLGVPPETAAVVVLVDRVFGVYLPAVLGWLPVATLDLPELFASDT
jgi:uncharacterized protein (TIRG00374 family)